MRDCFVVASFTPMWYCGQPPAHWGFPDDGVGTDPAGEMKLSFLFPSYTAGRYSSARTMTILYVLSSSSLAMNDYFAFVCYFCIFFVRCCACLLCCNALQECMSEEPDCQPLCLALGFPESRKRGMISTTECPMPADGPRQANTGPTLPRLLGRQAVRSWDFWAVGSWQHVGDDGIGRRLAAEDLCLVPASEACRCREASCRR